jgi:hypothetical protein
MHVNDTRICGVAFAFHPTAPRELRDYATDAALLEAQALRESALRQAGLPRKLEQRVGFGDRDRLPTWCPVGPMQSQCPH